VRQPIKLAQAKLAVMRQNGLSPGHGGEAAKKRGAANRAAMGRVWAWSRSDAGQAEARKRRAE